MSTDVFGNLREWGEVLTRLAALTDSGLLDEHQAGLARILRYRGNWQLTERALAAALQVRQANDLLVAEVLHTLVSPDVHVDARLLAAKAMAHLLPRRPRQEASAFDGERAKQTMRDLLRSPTSPVLQAAIREALDALA